MIQILSMLIGITCTDALSQVYKNMPLTQFVELLEKQRLEELSVKLAEKKLLEYYVEKGKKK